MRQSFPEKARFVLVVVVRIICVAFVIEQLGKQHDNVDCIDLAVEVLRIEGTLFRALVAFDTCAQGAKGKQASIAGRVGPCKSNRTCKQSHAQQGIPLLLFDAVVAT